jgi:hypothetical protein
MESISCNHIFEMIDGSILGTPRTHKNYKNALNNAIRLLGINTSDPVVAIYNAPHTLVQTSRMAIACDTKDLFRRLKGAIQYLPKACQVNIAKHNFELYESYFSFVHNTNIDHASLEKERYYLENIRTRVTTQTDTQSNPNVHGVKTHTSSPDIPEISGKIPTSPRHSQTKAFIEHIEQGIPRHSMDRAFKAFTANFDIISNIGKTKEFPDQFVDECPGIIDTHCDIDIDPENIRSYKDNTIVESGDIILESDEACTWNALECFVADEDEGIDILPETYVVDLEDIILEWIAPSGKCLGVRSTFGGTIDNVVDTDNQENTVIESENTINTSNIVTEDISANSREEEAILLECSQQTCRHNRLMKQKSEDMNYKMQLEISRLNKVIKTMECLVDYIHSQDNSIANIRQELDKVIDKHENMRKMLHINQ